jgi:hypothetical protein
MKKYLLLAALLLVPALAQAISANLSVTVVPAGGNIACAIGPNAPALTGVVATDVATAGFGTCVLNSDFSTAFFANFNNWLGGDNSCGSPASPIWYNSLGTPCSDYTIISDPNYGGQVLDMRFTNADLAAGRRASQIISQPGYGSGHAYPQALYVEQRFRLSASTPNVFNGDGQNLIFQPFLAPPSGAPYSNFVELNFAEFYFNPIGIASSLNPAPGVGNFNYNLQTALEYCQTSCSNFDPTIYHTYGALSTTDGNGAMSWCLYIDGTKLGCYNNTGITPTISTWNALQMLIIEVGPGNDTPNPFNGPADIYYQYMRVYDCLGWNAVNALCPGTVVNH